MEKTRKMNFPICGQIQHGIQEIVNNKKKVKELGYFIAKVKDDNLKFLLNRFNEKLDKKTAITIRFFDEDPFTVRQIRYNQGGKACYCMEGEKKGKQKVQNKWTTIECKEDCQYRIKTGLGRAMCNEEGTLKFMLPEICTDKIWYMKITSHTSIDILRDYIKFQKQIGNSLIGDYVIFLKEVEHTVENKKYKNKVVDIVKKEDFISNNEIVSFNQTNLQNQSQLSTYKAENVENSTEINESKSKNFQNDVVKEQKESEVENIEQKAEITEKKTSKKAIKTKKEKKNDVGKITETQEEIKMNTKFERYHVLINTETKILTKDGKPTEYLYATFENTNGDIVEVIIPPKYAQELKECNLGTTVFLDLQTKGDKTFTNSIEYIEKYIKDVAA